MLPGRTTSIQICDARAVTPDATTVGTLVSDLCGWIDRLFPDVERGDRLKRALSERFADDPHDVTAAACRSIEAVAHAFSRHFALEYASDGSLVPDRRSPGWPPQDPGDVRLRGGSVAEVTRRRDGIGDPGTVTLVLDWLLGGEATHVSDVTYRTRTRQWWTTGRLTDVAPSRTTPVMGVISEHTFSSGEALAYHLQAHGRARLVGERTPGAGDHITPVCVSRHVRAFLPEARVRDAVTGTNWEGTGVVPDIACPASEALAAAIKEVLA